MLILICISKNTFLTHQLIRSPILFKNYSLYQEKLDLILPEHILLIKSLNLYLGVIIINEIFLHYQSISKLLVKLIPMLILLFIYFLLFILYSFLSLIFLKFTFPSKLLELTKVFQILLHFRLKMEYFVHILTITIVLNLLLELL